MSVSDITPIAVVAAIRAGHDDVDKLAEKFVVLHTSHTLRSTLKELGDAGRVEKVEQLPSGAWRLRVLP
ncbi:hypothetical protein [Actinoplanes sp. NPDC051494]|uniref:hypothetical protein n=1 Tax=Actinoplanes sp. NPDC051494 TaxID=3363907 RepID=UPI00378A1145